MVSKGFLPAWTDANEIWPGVCQSCVITTFEKPFAIRLITEMTCSPSLTARLPPGRKQFWTSITRRAEASSILIEAAAQAGLETTAAIAVVARPARMCLRSGMLHLLCKSKPSKSLRQAAVKKLARWGVGGELHPRRGSILGLPAEVVTAGRMISAQTRSAFVARENRYPLFPIML